MKGGFVEWRVVVLAARGVGMRAGKEQNSHHTLEPTTAGVEQRRKTGEICGGDGGKGRGRVACLGRILMFGRVFSHNKLRVGQRPI